MFDNIFQTSKKKNVINVLIQPNYLYTPYFCNRALLSWYFFKTEH